MAYANLVTPHAKHAKAKPENVCHAKRAFIYKEVFVWPLVRSVATKTIFQIVASFAEITVLHVSIPIVIV